MMVGINLILFFVFIWFFFVFLIEIGGCKWMIRFVKDIDWVGVLIMSVGLGMFLYVFVMIFLFYKCFEEL